MDWQGEEECRIMNYNMKQHLKSRFMFMQETGISLKDFHIQTEIPDKKYWEIRSFEINCKRI